MLNGKTALITGGGRGIGREIALTFARNGARIAVAARTTEQVEQVAKEIGNNAIALVCDVADSESVTRMFSDCVNDLAMRIFSLTTRVSQRVRLLLTLLTSSGIAISPSISPAPSTARGRHCLQC